LLIDVGTGKTLVARALANECSQGDVRVAFYMRKGAGMYLVHFNPTPHVILELLLAREGGGGGGS